MSQTGGTGGSVGTTNSRPKDAQPPVNEWRPPIKLKMPKKSRQKKQMIPQIKSVIAMACKVGVTRVASDNTIAGSLLGGGGCCRDRLGLR